MRNRRTNAVFVVLALVASMLFVARDARPVEAAPTTDLLVGDSVMAGMTSSSRSVLSDHFFDAKVCRRLIATSCSYRGVRPINALSVVQAYQGHVNRAFVVAAGYNDSSISAAVDAIVAEARRQGVPHVVWLTYREAGNFASTYREFNSVLALKAFQYPELQVADWANLSRNRSDWVASDGLHLNASGAAAMAGLIADTLAGKAPGVPIPPPAPPEHPAPEPPAPPPRRDVTSLLAVRRHPRSAPGHALVTPSVW